MSENTDQVQAKFHNRAMEIFFMVHHSFEQATQKLNRRNHEKDFQVLKKQYAKQLEEELSYLAQEILFKNRREKQSDSLSLALSRIIRDYLHRFVVKAENSW